ncbi:hypothetical protein QO004_006069 [Rhizobium mesoamericanum]|nr:hypothetical protein [Rhizobium mesoamericanum]
MAATVDTTIDAIRRVLPENLIGQTPSLLVSLSRGLLCAPVIAEWQGVCGRIIGYAATKAGAPVTANLP